jgi:general secretion pathway protein E
MARQSLRDILIAQGKITVDQLTALQRSAHEQNISWQEYSVKQGIFTYHDLARATAEAFNLPLIEPITEAMVPPELLSRVPLRFLRESTIIPAHLDERSETITLITDRPDQFQPLDELRMLFGQPLAIAVAPRPVIIDAINKYYPLEGEKQMIAELAQEEEITPEIDFGEIGEEDILGMASEAPIIKLVNHVLYQAVKRDASDIHIEPFERELHVRYRIDGILHTVMTPPKRAQAALVSRIKIMAHMNIAEKRKPQDGRIQLKVANKAIDIRVSALPVIYGERIVMRLLDKSRAIGRLEELGMSPHDFEVLTQSIHEPNGIILVTGPTGSGKTSTLYAVLNRLNTPEVNIITVEDPVEYQMMGIAQTQVREKAGLTFASALRAILRQDPDIIMIGETRDAETAQIAIQSALTGHLVLSTLHTNSAAAAVTRLIDMGIEPFLVASTIVTVIAQRLVRRLCDHCKEAYIPEKAELDLLNIKPEQVKSITFYRAVGCSQCLHSGYRGRLAIFECMRMSPTIGKLIMQRADTSTIERAARQEGMSLLVEDGIHKIRQGLTSIEEVVSEATFHGEE